MKLSALFGYRTPTDVPLNAPVESTIQIPIHRGPIAWRLVCSVAVIVGCSYALLDRGMHYGAPSHFDLDELAHTQASGDVTKDLHTVYSAATDYASHAKDMAYSLWPLWAFGGTALVLITSGLAFFREFARLQSIEPGLTLSPRGLKTTCDMNRRAKELIPWSEMKNIEVRVVGGLRSVAITLRDPARCLEARPWFDALNFSGADRVVIPTRTLRIDSADLAALLSRYFAEYGHSSTTKVNP